MSADRKQLRLSLGRYRQLHALEPDNIGHLEQLARISLALGKPKRAAEYLVSRSDVLARRGEFATALVDCDSALSLVARYKPAMQMRKVIEQIQARHRAAALMRPTRDPSAAPQTPEPDAVDVSAPARPFDPPTMELGAHDLLTITARPVTRPPQIDAPAPAAAVSVNVVPVDVDAYAGPIVDASALLAVYEVDGVDVVPVATQGPRPAEREAPSAAPSAVDSRPMPILRAPGDDPPDAPTISRRDTLGDGPGDTLGDSLDDRDTLNVLPPAGDTMTARGADDTFEPVFPTQTRPRAVTTGQVEGVVHMITDGPAPSPSNPPAPPLPETPLLTALPRATRADLLHTGAQLSYAVGEVLVAPLTPRSAVYVVLYGLVDLVDQRTNPPQACATLEAGALLGDLELVHGGPWRFEVIAREATGLLRVEDAVLDALRQRFPAFDALLRAAADRRHADWLLGANPMFRVLGPNERDLMTLRMRPQALPPNAALCRQGDALDGIVLVAAGELIVRRDGVSVARLGAGRFAGLGALGRGDGVSSADIAAGPNGARVYRLDRDALEHLCAFPAIRALIEAGGRQRA